MKDKRFGRGLSLLTVGVLFGSTMADVGETLPASTAGWDLPFVAVFMFAVVWAMGFVSNSDK